MGLASVLAKVASKAGKATKGKGNYIFGGFLADQSGLVDIPLLSPLMDTITGVKGIIPQELILAGGTIALLILLK